MKTRLGAAGTLLSLVISLGLACSGSPQPAPAPNPDGVGGAKPPAGKPDASSPSAPGSGGSTGSGSGPSPGTPADAGPSSGGAMDASRRDARSEAGAGSTPGGSGGSSGGGGGSNPGSGGPSGVSDAGSPPAGPAGAWARNVTVGLVEVTQGVFVKIGEGSAVVPTEMRNAPLIEGRPLFVRVHLNTAQGFQARPLRGVLTLGYGDGSNKAYEDKKSIAGSSNPDRLDSTINFLVPAADVKPGAKLSVAVYEEGMAAGADPDPLPKFPAADGADLAIKAGRMVLDVVAMPVTGPSGTPLLDTPERRKKLENDLYDLYPVQQVNLRIREPLKIDARMASSSAGFTALRNARMTDNAKPWEYYHLLVGRNDTSFSFLGVASGAGAGAGDGNRRVGITVVSGQAIDGNTNTAAHEIGHNHGRNHPAGCSLRTGDSMYPYMGAALSVNGFSLSTMQLKNKAMWKDLMGYCRPRWISDYQWRALEARVRLVSALSAGTPGTTTLVGRSLQAWVGPGERPDFGVVPGHLVDDESAMAADRKARLTLADGRVIETAIAVQTMSDELTRELSINLPNEEVTRAEVIIDGQTFMVPVTSLPGY